MEKVRLGDVCIINPKSPKLHDDFKISFVPMQKVGENGEFDPSEIKKYKDVKKGFTYFKNGDVLFAKITPCMENGKGAIADSLENGIGFGSTEFHILRPLTEHITSKWLFHLLSWPIFRKSAEKNMTGSAGQKRVPKSYLEEYSVFIPTLKEQNRIADELEKLTELINKRKQQLSKLDELVKARFVELFGDMKTNPNSYEVVRFEDCIEYMGDIGSNGANSVVVEHLDMKDEEDYALMVRFLNFTKNDFTDDVKYVSKEAYDFFKKSQIFGGELIICKIGSAGQNYVMPYLNRPVSLGLNQIMVRINKKVLMPYMYQYLHTKYGQMLIDSCINGAVTKSITKTELKKIPVVIPPIELQKQFTAFVEQTDKSKLEVQKNLEKLELLKKALMQKYFG